MTEAQKEYYLIEKGEFVELANVHTEGISPARIFDISVRVMARPYKSDAVLDEKKAILGKLAERLRQEFCQDDDEEYYLSSYDFESVLEEINQEFEDEEELRQQKERKG